MKPSNMAVLKVWDRVWVTCEEIQSSSGTISKGEECSRVCSESRCGRPTTAQDKHYYMSSHMGLVYTLQ